MASQMSWGEARGTGIDGGTDRDTDVHIEGCGLEEEVCTGLGRVCLAG